MDNFDYRKYLKEGRLFEEDTQMYVNDNDTKFRPINQNEFDSLNEFGVIGVFQDEQSPGEDFIASVMYDKMEDFDSDQEAEETFNTLFTNPDMFEDMLWDDVYDSYKRISNKDRFELKNIIPATFA